MKKNLILIFCLIILLSACSSDTDTAKSDNKKFKTKHIKYSETKPLKVAILTSDSGIDNDAFIQSIYESILELLSENKKITLTAIQQYEKSEREYLTALNKLIDSYDVFVLTSQNFAKISSIAKKNLDKKFILVDLKVENDNLGANVLALNINVEQSGFLAGIAAANESKLKKVAIINGTKELSNIELQNSFYAGVKYANLSYDTGVEIIELKNESEKNKEEAMLANCIGRDDISTSKFIAQELINEDVDVIFSTALRSNEGIFAALKESASKDFVIGYEKDYYDSGENKGENIVLTSAKKEIGSSLQDALISIINDEFKSGKYNLDLNTSSTGLFIYDNRHGLSKSTLKIIEECESLLKENKINPLENFEFKDSNKAENKED